MRSLESGTTRVYRKLKAALDACRDEEARRAVELAMAVMDTDFYTTRLRALTLRALAEGRFRLAEGYLVQSDAGDVFRLQEGLPPCAVVPVFGDTPTATCILWELDKRNALRVKVALDGQWSIQRDGVVDYIADSCAEVFEQFLAAVLEKT